jgi:lipoprotein-releasing system ATP-binding protein
MAEKLIARGVAKSYSTEGGVLRVLEEVDVSVGAGEVVAVVGVSGVGKSTLLHVLGGLDRPQKGEVIVDGQSLAGLSSDDLARLRNRSVGFVFQFHYLLPEFSALENVMMPRLIRREGLASARERARALLVDLGLEARLHHIPAHLSGGEQQRVAIARALAAEPALLLADEPTGNLDPRTGAAVFELMRTVSKARDMGCLVATHNENLANTCDRVVHLCEGRLREVLLKSPESERRNGPERVPGG